MFISLLIVILPPSLANWTVLQEAVATGNSELVALILQYRDHQRSGARLSGIPQLLQQLPRMLLQKLSQLESGRVQLGRRRGF